MSSDNESLDTTPPATASDVTTPNRLHPLDNANSSGAALKDSTALSPSAADIKSKADEINSLLQAANRSGGFGIQLYATIVKNVHQKRRMPVSCLLELLLPVIFVCGLIGAWSAASVSLNDARMYIPPDNRVTDASVVLGSLLCHRNVTNVPADFPIPACPLGTPDSQCISPGEIPLDGLCTTEPWSNVSEKAKFIAFRYDEQRLVPSLDEMIILRWIARGVLGEVYNRGPANFNLPVVAMTHGHYAYFYPDTPQTRSVIDYLNTTSKLFRYVAKERILTTKDEADRCLLNPDCEGVAWFLMEVEQWAPPASAVITMRFNKTSIPWTSRLGIISQFRSGFGAARFRNYWTAGWLSIQNSLHQKFYEDAAPFSPYPNLMTTQPRSQPPVSIAAMPYTKYRDSEFLIVAGQLSPLVLVLAYLYSVSQLVKRVVEEKEKRLREGMLIMGLHHAAFYVGWLVTYLVQMLLSSLIIAILLKVTILQQTDMSVVFVIYVLFSFSTVTFATMLASFFNKSRVAALMAPLIFFVTAIPTFAFPIGTDPEVYLGFSIFSPSAFAEATKLIFNYERARGFGWKDFNSSGDDIPLSVSFTFLVCDMILYFVLAIYFDQVLPSEWGQRKHPLFCILPSSFLRGDQKGKKDAHESSPADVVASTPTSSDPYEEGGLSLVEKDLRSEEAAGVVLKGLRKEFEIDGETRVAVSNLDMRLYPDEITVLLGHNGAGKTTTMNMITGMLPTTQGECLVYGKSIHEEMLKIRNEIGLCPQHNILWSDVTVREHLQFFASIKGITGPQREKIVDLMIDALDLREFADVQSGRLSGGNKRKLSVAISFVGGGRLIILDEPTAGMDVATRRHTWEMIRAMSPNRTILLTTHFMDEADLLGSTITILNRGKVHCSGSSLFLKSRLGVGYNLNVAVEHGRSVAAVEEKVLTFVPEAKTLPSKGAELIMGLPTQSQEAFPPLLQFLESPNDLAIKSYGMSCTTLEEIFLRIEGEADDEDNKEHKQPGEEDTAPTSPTAEMSSVVPVGSGTLSGSRMLEPLWREEQRATFKLERMTQFRALFAKRFHNARRDGRTVCLQIITPILCILLAMGISTLELPGTPRIPISPKMYSEVADAPFDLMTDNCPRDSPSYVNSLYSWKTPPVATPTPYNFSRYLLDTYDQHSNPRFVGFQCFSEAEQAASRIPSVLMCNTTGHHSGAEGAAAYSGLYLKHRLGIPTANLALYSHPLDWSKREQQEIDGWIALIVGFFILIPFTFIPSTFVSWIVKERETHAKHLQTICGLDFFAFWSSNFVFDTISFLITEVLMLLVFAAFQREEYVGSGEAFAAVLVLFTLYGLAGVAASYLSSFLFETHGTAQNIVMLVNFIAGFLLVVLAYFLSLIDSTKDIAKVLKFFFRVVPSYCLGEGILNIATVPLEQSLGENVRQFEMDVIGWPCIYLAIEIPLFMILTMAIDHPARRRKQQILLHDSKKVPPPIEDEDVDVSAERDRIESEDADPDDLVRVKHLRKVYPGSIGEVDKVAVHNLSFGVPKGEVFAFLGTNGAGKTTTMGILTGDVMPTMGCASIAGYDVVSDAKMARRQVGYCPQFDALFDLLTPLEHLQLYVAMRAIPTDQRSSVIEDLLSWCDLQSYRGLPAHQLSGGNKRKLSLAIALVGGPPVLFLDEPSAGMDPKARRILWEVIERAALTSSVVLTTHHLEEVEVLADRVAMMVQGQLQCIGSLQHLKNKFGGAFEMSLKVGSSALVSDVKAFVAREFPGSVETEEKHQRLHFEIDVKEDFPLSKAFTLILNNYRDLGITDYSISQASLEHVFLRICERHEEAEGAEK